MSKTKKTSKTVPTEVKKSIAPKPQDIKIQSITPAPKTESEELAAKLEMAERAKDAQFENDFYILCKKYNRQIRPEIVLKVVRE